MRLLHFLWDIIDEGLGGSNVVWSLGTSALKSKVPQPKKMSYERLPKLALFPDLMPAYKPLPQVNNVIVDAKIELHEAKRAGTHLDFRFVVNGTVYDFAVVKKINFPGKGEVYRVVRRNNHTLHYFETDKHTFPEGTYGEGEMSTIWRGKMRIVEMNPEKMEFIIDDGLASGRYCIFTEESPVTKEGSFIVRMKDPERTVNPRQDFSGTIKKVQQPNSVAEVKIDGANNTLVFEDKPGHMKSTLISRRESVNGGVINHFEKVLSLPLVKVPERFIGRKIHVEVVTAGLNPHKTAGLLNSKTSNAIINQINGDSADRLQLFAWDLEGEGTYEERFRELQQLSKDLGKLDLRNYGVIEHRLWLVRLIQPRILYVPNTNETCGLSVQDFVDMYTKPGFKLIHWAGKFVIAKSEGVIVKDKGAKYYGDKWTKVKAFDEHTVTITGMTEGENKYKGTLGSIQFEGDNVKGTVGTGFTDLEREEIWAEKDNLIGVEMDVKGLDVTHHGVLRGPSFISIKP